MGRAYGRGRGGLGKVSAAGNGNSGRADGGATLPEELRPARRSQFFASPVLVVTKAGKVPLGASVCRGAQFPSPFCTHG